MKTAICIANGPSLTAVDVDFCKGKGTVYAVKEARHLAPWADVLYAADTDWWEKFQGCPDFAGERWTVSHEAHIKYGINYLPCRHDRYWSNDQAFLASGAHSGFQALNLAVLQGADRVVLLGYDLGHTIGKPKHWWDSLHPRETRNSDYKDWIKRMNLAAPLIPVPVINATVTTALQCFRRQPLRDIFR